MSKIDLSEDLTKQQITLRSWFIAMGKRGLPEIKLMNRLQEMGLISDNCVGWTDIADADSTGVITYLRSVKS